MGNTVSRAEASTLGALRHSLYFGLQARIAKRLGITRSVVSRVMNGGKTSARVNREIERELSRIEGQIARAQKKAAGRAAREVAP